MTKRYYKVLSGGRSKNGGDHTWDLPKPDGSPGEWQKIPAEQPIRLCSTGFHVTEKPVLWFHPGDTVYLAEVAGDCTDPDVTDTCGDPTKIAARECRLIRELTPAELAEHGIFVEGTHAIITGRSFALGSAVVTAYGSAQVTASGSAQVTAYDSAQVTAYDSAQVTAYDSAQVTAYGSAQVTAYGSAQVTAYGSAQVTAYGSAQVTAYGSTTVIATRWATPKIELQECAAEISWASGMAAFRTATSNPAKT